MSKKTLLNETTVRQFMKYANIGGLTETFINETYGEEEVVEEEAVEEGMGHYAEDEEGIEAMDDDLPVDDAPVDDLDADPEAEMADTSEASVEALVDALADTITQVTGVEVTAAGDADVEAELPGDEGPVDDMADAPMGDEEAPLDDEEVLDERAVPVAAKPSGRAPTTTPGSGEHGAGSTAQASGALRDARDEGLSEEEVVEETMKRVMARLQEMKKDNAESKKREELIEAVTAAVEKRLASK